VDYEVELAVVIGKACKNATRANALDFVAGYTVANDVSARRWQGRVQFSPANLEGISKEAPNGALPRALTPFVLLDL
jgi:2-keto-4-pentenoate hydratase/2-oxohepta-3-ene-1,7-dioic acid hydratase in catechol pathway